MKSPPKKVRPPVNHTIEILKRCKGGPITSSERKRTRRDQQELRKIINNLKDIDDDV